MALFQETYQDAKIGGKGITSKMVEPDNIHLPSIESMSAAIAVSQAGSFSAAALALDLTHAAVSRRIAALEEWAGVKIFARHARGVRVTEDGQRILSRLESALLQIEAASVKPHSRNKLPVVRLALTPSFTRFFLLPRVALLEGNPKDIHIDIVTSLTHADLTGGEVDLAIRYGRGTWENVHAIRLFDDEHCLVASPKLATGRKSNLRQLPLLHAGDTSNWRSWCLAQKVPFQPKPMDRIFSDYSLALEAACNGLGLALWNRRLHGLEKFGNELIPLDYAPTKGQLAYYLLARAHTGHSPIEVLKKRILANI